MTYSFLENHHGVTKSTKKRAQYLSQRRKARKEIQPAFVTPDRCRLRRPEKVTPRKDKSSIPFPEIASSHLSFPGVTFSGHARRAGQRSGATAQLLSFLTPFEKKNSGRRSFTGFAPLREIPLCTLCDFVVNYVTVIMERSWIWRPGASRTRPAGGGG
jgi:hypothetical protein